MKTKLLKIGIVITALIFTLAGASWADGRKYGKHHQGGYKYSQNHHYTHSGRHSRAWNNRHQPAEVHRHYHRTKVVHKHYYSPAPVYVQPAYPHFPYACAPGYCAHGPVYNGLSVSALIFQPGFAFSIAAGSQW